MHSIIWAFIGMLFLILSPTELHAQSKPEGTPSEQARLPKYCLVRFKDDKQSPEANSVIAKMGFQNFLSIHHYCYAQVFLQRAAVAQSQRDADYQRQLAVKEYGYMIRAATPDFWMRPQMYVELGRIHVVLRNHAEATRLYGAAIAANPTYLSAYLLLIGQLRQRDGNAQALEIATVGLRNLPDSEALKKLYLELGGKPPFPEPLRSPRSEQSSSKSSESREAEVDARVNRTEGDGPSEREVSKTDQTSTAQGEQGLSAPEGGNCRFCPPQEIQEKWRDTFR